MKILRALSLLFLVVLFSFALSNQEILGKYVESLHLSADASDAVSQTIESDFAEVNKQAKPQFMQLEKINQHELPAQARIGYLLSRGF